MDFAKSFKEISARYSFSQSFEGEIFDTLHPYFWGLQPRSVMLGKPLVEGVSGPVSEEVVESKRPILESTPAEKILFIIDSIGDKPEKDNLLLKMIEAMGLSGHYEILEFSILGDSVKDIIAEKNAPVCVSFGAKVTSALLERDVKLSQVHGEFLTLKFSKTPLFPVFHPDILAINPNMKRTAWEDLKKVINFISDNPD